MCIALAAPGAQVPTVLLGQLIDPSEKPRLRGIERLIKRNLEPLELDLPKIPNNRMQCSLETTNRTRTTETARKQKSQCAGAQTTDTKDS